MIAAAAAALLVAVVAGFVQVARLRRPSSTASPAAEPTPVAAPVPPGGSFVRLLRRKRWLRVALSLTAVGLLAGSAGVIGYPFYTNLVTSRLQSDLDREFASPEIEAAYTERRVEIGESLTRIVIPRLGVETIVVEGVTSSALRAGAGHYPTTPLPCEVGNVAIAGHRTTYGRPFHNLDLLEPGDTIILETPIGQCTYQIEAAPAGSRAHGGGASWIVPPSEVSVIDNVADAALLTLTTCHPKGSANERLIVRARMISAQAGA